MADPTPKPSPYTLVHAAGFPCGATSGRYGTGWGPVTCPKCLPPTTPTPTATEPR